MITLDKDQLIIIIFLILSIFVLIIVFIKEYLEGKLEDEKDKWIKQQNDINTKSELKYRTYLESYYKRQFEWYKHDQEVKKQPEYSRVTFKLYGKGNETLTIDYIKGNCELRNDGFYKIKDKDGNIILLNQKFIKEVRVYEAGNTRGSSEDDKG